MAVDRLEGAHGGFLVDQTLLILPQKNF